MRVQTGGPIHRLWSLPRQRCCAIALLSLAGEARRAGADREDRAEIRAALRRVAVYLQQHGSGLPR